MEFLLYYLCGGQIIVMKISKKLKAKNKQATILYVNSEDRSKSGNVFVVGKGQNNPKLYLMLLVEILWLRDEKRMQFVEYLLGPAYGGRDYGTPLTGNSHLRPDKKAGF